MMVSIHCVWCGKRFRRSQQQIRAHRGMGWMFCRMSHRAEFEDLFGVDAGKGRLFA